ncbi:MAG TPA: hypothetical protein VHV30_17130 [Polyangiaceae bacterium]|jgi:hypothetical protein|nr:hypothetical protein [Polyangiaceae bacterium]
MRSISPTTRKAGLTAGKALLAIALLLAPWPVLPTVMTVAFCVVSSVALDACANEDGQNVHFAPADGAAGQGWEVRLAGDGPQRGAAAPSVDLRIFYDPFALFLGLALAAPIAAGRRRRVLAWGLGALALRMAFTIGAPLASFLGALEPGGVVDVVSRVAFKALIEPPNMLYATPIILFGLALLLTSEDRASNEAPARPPPARPASSLDAA